MPILMLDSDFQLGFTDPKFQYVLDFFQNVLAGDTVSKIESLLKNKGIGFETESCELEADPGEPSFEGVKFMTHHWWNDFEWETYISLEDFQHTLGLVAQCHLNTCPEDEAKLKVVFKRYHIPLPSGIS